MSESNLFYCPFCKREIEPESDDEEGLLYVHDNVPHDADYNFINH